MSTIYFRMKRLNALFVTLENTSGRNAKLAYIKREIDITPDIKDDLAYCFEILSGNHKLGYTLEIPSNGDIREEILDPDAEISLREFCKPLFQLSNKSDLSLVSIGRHYLGYGWFLTPLFNREWRLGINRSQVDKRDISPMLAKKFDINKFPIDKLFYITEKLDGNRCIARYSEEKQLWEFFSRSGKVLNVSFDMSEMPVDKIYDGEVMSRKQLFNPSQENFNALSGALNSINGDKRDLVYVIFDIIESKPYTERRMDLDEISQTPSSGNVFILPVLEVCYVENLVEVSMRLLAEVTKRGGEGIMINLGSRHYQNRRTDSLLKLKEVFTMDMCVVGITGGTGKNEGIVGSLVCEAEDITANRTYSCSVGSGLSDYQRLAWAEHPEDILNKIVEVAYFSTSQDASLRGTRFYSLRFPRFRGVREDKSTTSVD